MNNLKSLILILFIFTVGCKKNPLMEEGFAPANHDPFCTTCDTPPVLGTMTNKFSPTMASSWSTPLSFSLTGDASMTCTANVVASSSNTSLFANNALIVSGTAPNCILTLNSNGVTTGSSVITLTATHGTAVTTGTFTIHLIPSVEGTYSVRKVVLGYSGSVMKVRHGSNNAEADINFDTNGTVGATSVATITSVGSSSWTLGQTLDFATFYSATNVFVTTLYDQSGHSRNATNGNPAQQPRIVNAGVLDRTGSTNLPSIYFNGSVFLQANSVMPSNADYTKNAVINQTTNATTGNFLSGVGGGSHAFFFSNSTSPNLWHSNNFAVGPSMALNTLGQTTGVFTIANLTGVVYVNGVAGSPATSGNSFNDSGIQLGAYNGGYNFTGYISEAFIFNSALSNADRQALELNQKTHYTLP